MEKKNRNRNNNGTNNEFDGEQNEKLFVLMPGYYEDDHNTANTTAITFLHLPRNGNRNYYEL